MKIQEAIKNTIKGKKVFLGDYELKIVGECLYYQNKNGVNVALTIPSIESDNWRVEEKKLTFEEELRESYDNKKYSDLLMTIVEHIQEYRRVLWNDILYFEKKGKEEQKLAKKIFGADLI